MCIEFLSPRSPCVREQDIDMIGRLCYLADEMLNAFELRAVGGYGNGFCAGGEVGEGVEGFHRGFAGVGFAGGDVDFRGAGLEKPKQKVC